MRRMNTDDYEGHTEGHWTWMGEEVFVDEGPTIARITSDNRADANLIADAPLLLAEVKRLEKRESVLVEHLSFLVEHQTAEVKRLRGLSNALWDHICLTVSDITDATDIWNEWSEEE